MCNALPLARVKHADDYTTEDLNADVEAFRLAFQQYVRARRSTEVGQSEREDSNVVRSQPYHKSS